jgi:hypothetical protein
MKLLIMQFSPVTSSLFGLNILLSTLSLCCSLNVRDRVSHPYRTTGIYMMMMLIIIITINATIYRVV